MSLRNLVGSSLLALALASPAYVQRERPKVVAPTIQIQVRYPNGSNVQPGVMLTVESEISGYVGGGQTDSLGKMTFMPPGADVYIVTAKFPGYMEASERVDLTTTPNAYVVLELRPKPGGQPAVPPEGPAGQISSVHAPPRALKEYKTGEKLLLKEGRIDASIPHLRKAIELYERFPEAYVVLGMAYVESRKSDQAMPLLQKALQLEPNSSAAHLALGAALNQKKDYPAAEAELTRGLQLNPNASEGEYELAKSYLATARWQDAETHAQRALQMRPPIPAAHVILGNLMLRKGDFQDATSHYREYLRLDPNGPMAEGTREALRKIEDQRERK